MKNLLAPAAKLLCTTTVGVGLLTAGISDQVAAQTGNTGYTDVQPGGSGRMNTSDAFAKFRYVQSIRLDNISQYQKLRERLEVKGFKWGETFYIFFDPLDPDRECTLLSTVEITDVYQFLDSN